MTSKATDIVALPVHSVVATASDAPPPQVITADECAVLLRLDRKAVYAAIQRNEIPGVRRIGKCIRIHRATVLAWLAEGQQGPGRPKVVHSNGRNLR